MSDQDQDVDVEKDATVGQKQISGKRRLFVKATAGALPAVLTLKSGAAFALNSAEMCVTKDNGVAVAADPLSLTTSNTDIWVRTEVNVRELRETGTTDPSFLVYQDPIDLSTWRHEDFVVGSVSPAGQRTFSNKFVFGSGLKMVGDSVIPEVEYDILDESMQFILVIMDELGAPVDVGKSVAGVNGLPYVTGSCWASAAPNSPPLV